MIQRITFSTPQSDSFGECLAECLDYIQLKTQKDTLLGVIFFIDASQPDSFREAFHTISQAVEKKGFSFPFNVLAQPGCRAVCIELWLYNALCKTEYLTFEGCRYTRLTSENGTSVWGIGLHHSDFNVPLQEQAEITFRQMEAMLRNEGMSLSDIIRQWNYVPGILTSENTLGKTIQHYQIFNDVRKHWYAKAMFEDGYPAATGIGVKTGPFSIDVVAFKSNAWVSKMGLSNPKQENAYQYDQQHLVGDALSGLCKNPPLFERAKLLTLPNRSMVIVSGTASILGQETVGIGDVRKQTEVAISNMLELITSEVTGNDLSFRFNYLRVYIKSAENRDTVKAICDSFFQDIPASYVLADICRDNLLVEIEGEAFAHEYLQ